jgi:hypothetical protein
LTDLLLTPYASNWFVFADRKIDHAARRQEGSITYQNRQLNRLPKQVSLDSYTRANMPTRKQSIATTKRDGIIADAVRRALYAMKLVNGITIESEGVRGTLQFEHEMAKLEGALRLLDVNTDDPSPAQFRHH